MRSVWGIGALITRLMVEKMSLLHSAVVCTA